MSSPNINIRIPGPLAERLDFLAHETGRTKSYYVREAIQEKIEELEDYYLALQSLENVNSGKSRTWTQEEVEQNRDLED